MRGFYLSCAVLCVPVCFYIAAIIHGRSGQYQGRLESGLCRFVCMACTIFYCIRLIKTDYKSSTRAFITAVCATISLAGVVLLLRTDPFLDNFEAAIKRSYNFREIQAWATNVLATNKFDPNCQATFLPLSNYPDWAATNHFTRPRIMIWNMDDPAKKLVRVAWGDTFAGLWGLDVGDAKMENPDGKILAPGVFFFVTP
jgi:hypothetical protein